MVDCACPSWLKRVAGTGPYDIMHWTATDGAVAGSEPRRTGNEQERAGLMNDWAKTTVVMGVKGCVLDTCSLRERLVLSVL